MNLHFFKQHKRAVIVLVVAFLLIGPALAMAQDASGAFDTLYTTIKTLLSGSLGKLLTILALAVALVVAVKVGSIIGILGAFAIALSAVYGPGVLESLFTATLPLTAMAHQAVHHVAGHLGALSHAPTALHGLALTPLR